jgi:erythromycin esterase-like protein
MYCLRFISVAFLMLVATSCGKFTIPEQQVQPLPGDVQQSLTMLASQSDVLLIGETHGTKEVPAIVGGLLASLSKLGYQALALEIPRDEQFAIAAWAKGDTDAVPKFFAAPSGDGRGNQQVLALVRRALRPPYEWKLICFDASNEEFMRQMIERLPKDAKRDIADRAARLSSDDIVALSLERDAMMAKNFAAEREKLPSNYKVVAICGNVHARTANHASEESAMQTLWPSFAAVLKRDHPKWQVRTINVQAFSGEYFNSGKVNKFNERPLAKVEAHSIVGGDWDWELNLPRTSAATFLTSPED